MDGHQAQTIAELLHGIQDWDPAHIFQMDNVHSILTVVDLFVLYIEGIMAYSVVTMDSGLFVPDRTFVVSSLCLTLLSVFIAIIRLPVSPVGIYVIFTRMVHVNIIAPLHIRSQLNPQMMNVMWAMVSWFFFFPAVTFIFTTHMRNPDPLIEPPSVSSFFSLDSKTGSLSAQEMPPKKV